MANQQNKHRSHWVLAVIAAAALLTACGGDKGDKTTQTAAKVNKEEITVHQINFALQRSGVRPDQAEAASRQVLERLIDQELAVQKAQELKLDRDPRVVQQIEFAKREIIARAYAERLGENVAKPSNDEIASYYNEKPALFKDRRIYSLQELQIEAKPEQFDAIRARLGAAKSLNEFVEYLKSADIRFAGNQAVRAAEQLPLAGVDAISKMKDGDSMVSTNPNGLTVLFLISSRSQPVDEVRARPAIEAFLLNQRRGELVQKDIKALRDSSKIEYVGKFAQGAPAAASAPQPQLLPSAPDTAAPAAAPAPAASGLDPASISKGMGLK